MRTHRRVGLTGIAMLIVALGTVRCDRSSSVAPPPVDVPSATPNLDRDEGSDVHGGHDAEATTLYVWASDQARVAPDFLAVIDFDRRSRDYGKVLRTVPIPPPGNVGNEAHHCHTSVDQRILACGGLLSVLKAQNDIFFFDISNARYPKFMFSTRAPNSSITDDFLPLPGGGFLVTNMGSATGGAGGRLVEFDSRLRLVAEYPGSSPADGGFNPHGIDADFSKNLLVTSDFINPVTTLNVFAGDVELRSSLRFWNLRERRITRTVFLPDQAGTMDVKLIPGDPAQLGAYYSLYDKYQLSFGTPDAPTMSFIRNLSGTTTLWGLEAEAQAVFGDVSFDLSGSYEHSRLGSALVADPAPQPGGPGIIQIGGRVAPLAPEWTFSAGAQYVFTLPNGATLTPRADYSFVSGQWGTPYQDLGDYLKARNLVNAEVAYAQNKYKVTLFATNAFNLHYIIATNIGLRYPGNPAQYGVRVERKF